jgi:hypothetical protein
MSIKPNKYLFSLNRQKQMSTLELWQQHLQALRRASQCPPQANDKSKDTPKDQPLGEPLDKSHKQSPNDIDASVCESIEMNAKVKQSFARSAQEY